MYACRSSAEKIQLSKRQQALAAGIAADAVDAVVLRVCGLLSGVANTAPASNGNNGNASSTTHGGSNLQLALQVGQHTFSALILPSDLSFVDVESLAYSCT